MNQSNEKKSGSEYSEKEISDMYKLLEINRIINSTLDMGKLLNVIMEIIKDIMNTEASTLFLFEEETGDLVFKVALGEAGKELAEKHRVKLGQGVAGWVADKKIPVFINSVYDDNRFDSNYDKITGFNTRSILCVPLLFKGKLLGVIQAINPVDKQGFDENDVALFSSFANQAVLAVQNALFFKNALEEQRIKNEIYSAKTFHRSLLPPVSKSFNKFHIAAMSIPAREVGGVFYDISYFDDETIGISLGDCHTKGISGALNASMLLGQITGISSLTHKSPHKVLRLVNNVAGERNPGLSLFYGLISCKKNMLQFANAGFAYPIIVRKNVARYLKFSTPISELETAPRKINVMMEPGDFFIIITDGIVNLKNRGAQNFGLKRIMDYLSRDFSSPQEIIDSLTGLADKFLDGLERREDTSIIVLQLEG
jgi:phosphoserine phosphatase RsbU/P